MDIIYWNVYIRQSPEKVLHELKEIAEIWKPEIIGLGEATKAWSITDDVPGYRRIQLRPVRRRGNENADSAILVRNDIEVTARRVWRMSLSWFVPGRTVRHTPRVYLVVKFKADGLRWRVAVGHWPFGRAQEETKRRVRRWFRLAPLQRSIFVGDLNENAAGIAAAFKGTGVRQVGFGVDRALFKNCRASANKLGYRGSDHPAVRFSFTK